MRTCKVCGSTEDSVPWVTKHGSSVGLLCRACASKAGKRLATKYRATPEGRESANKASRLAHAKAYAMPVSRNKIKAASKEACRRLRATPEGRERLNAAVKRYRETLTGQAKNIAAGLRWAKENPTKALVKTMRRHTAKLRRSPIWLTQEHCKAITQFYIEARLLTEKTGEVYHVDHIIPLQGKLVSGLHVPWNLQVLKASQNVRKSNHYEV